MANPIVDPQDTSRWSHHVNDGFYARAVEHVRVLSADWPEQDPTTVAEASAVLTREARLIDSGRLDDWLTMFSDDCLYWVPVAIGPGDPLREVSHAFDDRRRLTDRVFWHNTGLAYSQIPPSRVRHLIGNVEALDQQDLRFVRSNVVVAEFRPGGTKTYAGWCGHVLTRVDEDWQILLKQVNLIDSDQSHENLTLVL